MGEAARLLPAQRIARQIGCGMGALSAPGGVTAPTSAARLLTARRLATFAALALGLGALGGLSALRLHDGPLGPLPGGALVRGTLSEDQKPRWEAAGIGPTIELEVRPGAPWSVTTWAVVYEGDLYVAADFLNPLKRWPYFVLKDPAVVVRATGRRYRCSAVRVEDPGLVAALRQAFARKYALTPDGFAAHTSLWFFRLEPRPAAGTPAG
ncbi:MAG TPA: hypothetical protein VKM54_06945 [Myxococcota bacterium]|nr:hypothetical protein [Myxococcota bacterium]